MNLRPYQLDTVERIRASLRAGNKRILVCSPTGSGKTVMFANIASAALSRGRRVMVVVHLRELVDQTINKLVDAGVHHIGVVRGNDDRRDDSAPCQVVSIQSLARRDKPEADLVILDEAHRSTSASFQQHVWSEYQCPVLGFTATPCRTDKKGMGLHYEDLIVAAKMSELMSEGFVAEPIVYAPKRAPNLKGVKVKQGDFDQTQMREVMEGLSGDIVPTWLEKAGGRITIVFASGIEHSLDIVRRFREAGVPAEHLDAKTPEEERRSVIERLRSGRVKVVSNVGLFIEGLDCPGVRCVVVARPTLSLILHLQSAGRALRPGDVQPIILDHADNCSRHGLPQMDRDWSLDGGKKQGDSKGRFMTCSACFAQVRLATVCDACGLEMHRERTERVAPVEDKSVELHVVDAKSMEAEAFASLVEQARAKGMMPGWAAHQFKTKYQRFPPYQWKLETDKLYQEDAQWQLSVSERAKSREYWKSRKSKAAE